MVLFPNALRRGDRVAVVSPAGPVRGRDAIEPGLARLASWGLEPELLPHCLERDGYLAGSDEQRASDLQKALSDERYRAVFCTRGGYGVTRILDRIDFAPLSRDPKPVLGYSDITALLAAAFAAVELVGFHGPMLSASSSDDVDDECERLQRNLMFEAGEPARLPRGDGGPHPHTITSGHAEGVLVGGNLSLVITLLGTPWQIDTADKILFLEDVHEEPYRIDRMLTQLRSAKQLDHVAGIVLGDFRNGGRRRGRDDGREFERVFHDRLEDLDVPVTYGWPFGHRAQSWTLPVGVRAKLSAPDKSARPELELLEPAVTSR